MYTIENYLRICHDVYFPEIDFYYPENLIDVLDNTPLDGYYKKSLLKKEHQWVRELSSEIEADGFFAAFYRYGKNGTKGLVAFRGSDDIHDFGYHDFQLAIGKYPEIIKRAMDFYDEVKIFINTNPIDSLAFTGHSLGGAIAQLIGIEVNQKENKRYPVVCFNAPQIGNILNQPNNDQFTPDKSYLKITKLLNTQNPKCYVTPFAVPLLNNIKQGFDWYSTVYTELDKVINSCESIYAKIIKQKDLNLTPKYKQPAINVVYDILNRDFKKNLNNQNLFDKNFESNWKTFKKYNYIYNFNSLYDFVHTLGTPVGQEVTIDIDTNYNRQIWQNDAKYPKELFRYSRLRCEYRTILTLTALYKKSPNVILGKIADKRYPFHTEKLICEINLTKLLDKFKGIITSIVDKHLVRNSATHDLIYMLHTQHSMTNLGNAMLQNRKLIQEVIDDKHGFKVEKYQHLSPGDDYRDERLAMKRMVELIEELRINGSLWNCRVAG